MENKRNNIENTELVNIFYELQACLDKMEQILTESKNNKRENNDFN